MAEERRNHQEELEKTRQINLMHNAATLIQSHVRRRISTMNCANRRIEICMHERILMFIERFTVDGDFFLLIKSLNDDYIKFERTIRSTIEREEKLARVSSFAMLASF